MNETNELIICNKCNELMVKKLITYTEDIFGKEKEICQADAYVCTACGNTIFDNSTQEYINQRKHEITLEIMQDKTAVPILISNIRNLRLEKKLSQKQIGNTFGVTEQRYGSMERNTNNLTVIKERQLAKILGVSSEELYDLVYISEDLFEKLKNLAATEKNGEYVLNEIKIVKESREKLYKLRDELKSLNDEKRIYRFKFKKGEITELEYKNISDNLDKKTKEIKTLKDDKTNGLEKVVKKLESKHNLIIKQENIVDRLHWEIIKDVYKDEANLLFLQS